MSKELVMLVAEDDPNDVTLLRHALKRNGIAVHAEIVPDGDQVIKYLRGEAPYTDRSRHPFPDLLLLDLKMPLMSGVEVLQWLRAGDQCISLPVVMLSGSALSADVDHAYRLGVKTYFTKPHTVAELADLLRLIVNYWSCSQRPEELRAKDQHFRDWQTLHQTPPA
jgi:CheY-like chemotaxis protein